MEEHVVCWLKAGQFRNQSHCSVEVCGSTIDKKSSSASLLNPLSCARTVNLRLYFFACLLDLLTASTNIGQYTSRENIPKSSPNQETCVQDHGFFDNFPYQETIGGNKNILSASFFVSV